MNLLKKHRNCYKKLENCFLILTFPKIFQVALLKSSLNLLEEILEEHIQILLTYLMAITHACKSNFHSGLKMEKRARLVALFSSLIRGTGIFKAAPVRENF